MNGPVREPGRSRRKGETMKKLVLGAMLAVAGALTVVPGAKAQGFGYYSYGYAPPPPPPHHWEAERWRERMERRAYWRQQREMAERHAYEAGRRDAYRQGPSWAYR